MTNPLILYGSEAETLPVHELLDKYRLYPHIARLALGPAHEVTKPFSIDIGVEFMRTGMAAVSTTLVDSRRVEVPVQSFFNMPGSKLTGFNGFGKHINAMPIFTAAVRSTAKSLASHVVGANPPFVEIGLKLTRESFSDPIRTAVLCILGKRITGDSEYETEPFMHLLNVRSLIT